MSEHQKLLLDESPLVVQKRLAIILGLNEALVMQQIHYLTIASWDSIEISGRKWIGLSIKDWIGFYFGFWSISTLRRIFEKLEDKNLVQSKKPKETQRDTTKFYAINYKELDLLILENPIVQNEQTRIVQNEQSIIRSRSKDLYIKGGSLNKQETADLTGELEDELDDLIVALRSICKDGKGIRIDNDPFPANARVLFDDGYSGPNLQAFLDAWKTWPRPPAYDGKPVLKSVMDNIDNWRDDIKPASGKKQDSAQAAQAWKEVQIWVRNGGKGDYNYTSPLTSDVTQTVGRYELKKMTDFNEGTLRQKFMSEFEKSRVAQ